MTTAQTLTIRPYRRGDHDAVVTLNAYGLTAAGVPADVDVYAGDLDDVATTYLTERSTLLVGEYDGRVVAMSEVDDVTCEITRMRVAPEVQGRGYGRAILQALEAEAAQRGFSRAVLLTGPDQHPAIDLYQGSGYVVTAVEHHGDLAGVRMTKALKPPA